MKIEKIKKKKDNQYQIMLEDGREITTYDEVILKYNLLFRKDWDENIEKQIEEEERYYTYYNDAMKYLKKCIHSKKEVRTFLEKKEAKEEEIKKIMQSLEKKGIVNDEAFCSSFVSDMFYLHRKGPLLIRRELEKHEIEEALISKYIGQIDEKEIYDTLYKMLLQKINANHKYAKSLLRQKLMLYFTEKGYEKEMIGNIFEELYHENPLLLNKEYEKIKRQLAKKYEGRELEYKIVTKLYQKGFLKEEIDKINEESF